jgi:hypothetical protein
MAAHTDVPGRQDSARINLNRPDEVRHWSKRFRVSADQLQDAVRTVGDRPDAVEQYLKRSNGDGSVARRRSSPRA